MPRLAPPAKRALLLVVALSFACSSVPAHTAATDYAEKLKTVEISRPDSVCTAREDLRHQIGGANPVQRDECSAPSEPFIGHRCPRVLAHSTSGGTYRASNPSRRYHFIVCSILPTNNTVVDFISFARFIRSDRVTPDPLLMIEI